jgi:translocation protein SEC62
MPSPEQIAAMQRQLAIDAEKMGMTVPQFIGKHAIRRLPGLY